ncbi:MAG: TolC family protein [Cetobacterium sp.]|uniref:TolC family protein n=1 Tax=Cetobacterium sp. TaxID=2071632 RepID=UPI002FC9EACD
MKKILPFLLCMVFIFNTVYSKELGIGIILNESPVSNELEFQLKKELTSNFAGTDYTPKVIKIVYEENMGLDKAISSLEKNPKVDAIFIMSFEVPKDIKTLNKNKFYSFPLGFFPVNEEKLPSNVNYVYGDLNLKEDILLLKELTDLKRVALAMPDGVSSRVHENHKKLLKKMFNDQGIGLEVINYTDSDEQINNALDNVQAVYLLSYGEGSNKVLNLANSKKLPTLSVDFSSHMNKQTLLGYDLTDEIKRRARAAALNYMTYTTEQERGMISNIGDIRKNIFFNMGVAHQIEYYPSLVFLQQISTINEYKKPKMRLSMREAIDRSLTSNPTVLSSIQDIQSGIYNVKVTNSARLPQITANANYNGVERKAANVLTPQNSVDSYLQLSQVLFSDQLNANVYIQKIALDNNRAQSKQEELNTIYYVASTYLNILQLKAQIKIQKSNYALVKQSLNVAQINYKVGSGGVQDVYRLEASLAQALSDIASAEGEMKVQEAYLNNLLNYPVNRSYEYEDLASIAKTFSIEKDFLQKYAYGSKGTEALLQFLINGSIKNSQSVRQLDNSLKITDRKVLANSRERYLPVVQAVGNYNKNNIITPWGANTDALGEAEYWQAGISVQLPLIKGGEIMQTDNLLKSQKRSLEYQKAAYENQLAQLISQTFTTLLTDYVQTYTTEISATAAEKNLKIVTNLYAEGSVTITDLLDAQTTALTSQLNNVISNYSLLNSTVKLENIYGEYSITKSVAEREQMVRNLKSIIGN